MKITRDGVQYELTEQELYSAYLEQEHLFDLCDINDMFQDDNDRIADDYGLPYPTLANLFDDMAHEMRRNIDKYEMCWQSARDDAIKTVLEKYKLEHKS